MARIAAPATGQYSGLYEYVREKSEERTDRRSEYTYVGNGKFFRCPHHRRLEKMKRGEPVTAPEHMLPREVRQSAEFQRASRAIRRNGNEIRRAQTATVYPDGRITYRDATSDENIEDILPGEIPNLLPGEVPPPREECFRMRGGVSCEDYAKYGTGWKRS